MKKCTRCNGEGEVPTAEEMTTLRFNTGLTQKAFAEACGWSGTHQGEMERGTRQILPEKWKRAAEVSEK